jgi:hypothetical protein
LLGKKRPLSFSLCNHVLKFKVLPLSFQIWFAPPLSAFLNLHAASKYFAPKSFGLILYAFVLANIEYNLDYKSIKTIYEHEYLLIADQDEFNVSQNPSAVVTVGGEYESFTDTSGNIRRVYTKQPTKYIRKASSLENATGSLDYTYTYSGSVGTAKAGFEHWDLSGSMDSTGSFLAPFITTIGLYDDDCDLIAVAKLPQPIKSEHDLTVNFIVRFDT